MLNKFLNMFGNKIPCRSENTPLKIQNISDVKNRKSEIMQQYCKVKFCYKMNLKNVF